MSTHGEHEESSLASSYSYSLQSLESRADADVDDESIDDILQSVKTFRKLYRPGNDESALPPTDIHSDAESIISAATSISSFTNDGLPTAYLLQGNYNPNGGLGERSSEKGSDDESEQDRDQGGEQDVNHTPVSASTYVYYEKIFVDPVRDIDIAPALRFCCGWSPCCCCLYNKNHTEKDDDEYDHDFEETYNPDDYSTVRSVRTTRVPVLPSEIPKYNPYPVNKNALGLFFLNLFYHFGSSLWTGTVLSVYLYQILPRNMNTGIGIFEGIKIISRLIVTAFCSTNWKDKNINQDDEAIFLTRPTLMKIGGGLTLVAAVAQISLLAYIENSFDPDTDDDVLQSDEHHLVFQSFCILAMLWGIQSGFNQNRNGPAISLFRDSIYAELKRDYLTFYHLLSVLSSSLGALFSIILFLSLRAKDWNVRDLSTIMYFGMAIEIFAGCSMFFQKTKWKNGEDEPTSPQQTPVAPVTVVGANVRPSAIIIRRRRRWVPRLLFIHYLFFNVGSGMILPFFPLFFKINCSLGPTSIQTIFMLLPLLNELFSQLLYTAYTKLRLSDMETFLFAKLEGVIFLYLIILSQLWEAFGSATFWIACAFILRTVCVNSSTHVEDKIFTEATTIPSALTVSGPSEAQKRWSSRFEIVKILSYSFGAVIGGMSADSFKGKYGQMFLIAALFQTSGLLILGFMYPLVPKSNRSQTDEGEDSDSEAFTQHDDSLEQLLL